MFSMITNRLPSWLKRTTAGRKMVEEFQADELANRKKLVEEMQQLEAREADLLPPLQRAVEKAKTAAEVAWANFLKAQGGFYTARGAAVSASASIDCEIGTLRSQLRTTVDPRIAEVKSALDARWQRLHATPTTVIEGKKRESVSGKVWREGSLTTLPEVARAMAEIDAAMLECESLKEQAVDDVGQALRQLAEPHLHADVLDRILGD